MAKTKCEETKREETKLPKDPDPGKRLQELQHMKHMTYYECVEYVVRQVLFERFDFTGEDSEGRVIVDDDTRIAVDDSGFGVQKRVSGTDEFEEAGGGAGEGFIYDAVEQFMRNECGFDETGVE